MVIVECAERMADEFASVPGSADFQGDAARWWQARQIAEAYQVVIRVEGGAYVGRGVELPTAQGRGRTPNACVETTRAAMAAAVVRMLGAGEDPPRPEFAFVPQSPGRRSGRLAAWARGVLWAASGVCVVAIFAVAMLGAETVVVSGPIIGTLGSALIALGGFARYRWAMALGASHIGICITFLAMVNIARLSPRSAYVPFLCVGVPYVVGQAAATVVASRRMPRAERPWECEGCGYLLVGLSEARCPECGRGFDPRRWAGMPAPSAGVGAVWAVRDSGVV
jgi:hypothetical protein